MKQTINRLREKPRELRVQVAFVAAVCVTAVVGLAWGATLPMRLDVVPAEDGGNISFVPADGPSIGERFAGARENLGQVIGAFGGSDDELAEDENRSASGAYTTTAPENAMNANSYQVNGNGTAGVEPVSRKEVLISTTTSRTRE